MTLFGCGSENWKEMTKVVSERSDSFVVIQSQHFRATEAQTILDYLSQSSSPSSLSSSSSSSSSSVETSEKEGKNGMRRFESTNLEDVMKEMLTGSFEQDKSLNKEEEILLITGSLFLVAEARLALSSLHLFDFHPSDSVHIHDFFLTHRRYK